MTEPDDMDSNHVHKIVIKYPEGQKKGRWQHILERCAMWLARHGRFQPLCNLEGDVGMYRYFLLWDDEWLDYRSCTRVSGPPRWFPFNIFLHQWFKSDLGAPHTHPRWTISIVLAGGLWETVNRNKLRILRPGSIVFRRPSVAHTFFIPEQMTGRVWTLFIVGPRKYVQYVLLPDGTKVPIPVHLQEKYGTSFANSRYGAESCLPYADVDKMEEKDDEV